MTLNRFCLVYRVGVVLNISRAAAAGVEGRRTKNVRVASCRREPRDEKRAKNVSVAATTAKYPARTKNHKHAVELKITIESEVASNNQSSLPGGIAWAKSEIAVNEGQDSVRVACPKPRSTADRCGRTAEVAALAHSHRFHPIGSIKKLASSSHCFKEPWGCIVT